MSEDRAVYRVDRLSAYYGIDRPAATLPQRRRAMLPVVAEAAPGFGQALRAYRSRNRLTQSALGDLADLDHAHISRLESGERAPSRDAVERLATALHLTTGDRDRLLITAGMLTPAMEDALVQRLGLTLVNPAITDARKRQLRQAVALLVDATQEHQP